MLAERLVPFQARVHATEEQRFPIDRLLKRASRPRRSLRAFRGRPQAARPTLGAGSPPSALQTAATRPPEVSSTSSKKFLGFLTTVNLLLATASWGKVATLQVKSPLRGRLRLESLKEEYCWAVVQDSRDKKEELQRLIEVEETRISEVCSVC